MIYWLVILIYLSFGIDLIIWRIPSEANTFKLLKDHKINLNKKVIFLIAYLFTITFYICPFIMAIWALIYSPNHLPGLVDFIGIMLAFSGRLFTLLGARTLFAHKSADLLTSALFKWSRNPIVLGLHITIAGLLLIFSYWGLWIGFVIYVINIHYKIILEENYLNQKYGKLYADYKQKTPRYLII